MPHSNDPWHASCVRRTGRQPSSASEQRRQPPLTWLLECRCLSAHSPHLLQRIDLREHHPGEVLEDGADREGSVDHGRVGLTPVSITINLAPLQYLGMSLMYQSLQAAINF